jgi:hypothetical protein
VDKRIAEICYLLPAYRYKDGVIAGFQNNSVHEAFKQRVENLAAEDVAQTAEWKKRAFDLIIYHPSAHPSAIVIKEICGALRTGGTAVFLSRSGFHGGSLKKIISKQSDCRYAAKQTIFGIYGLTPSLDDIRLMVPLKSRACAAASLALYQPSLTKAKVMKHLAYLLGRVGLTSLWASYELIIIQKGDVEEPCGLPALAKELFGQNAVFALFTGTPGYLRKSTIQIMDPTGTILGYCKIGDTPQTKAILQNEANMLSLVRGLSLCNTRTPELLYSGEQVSGDFYLIQSTSKDHLSAAPLIPDDRHLDFLKRLTEQTKSKSFSPESACYRDVFDGLYSIRGCAGEELYQEIKSTLEWASRILTRAKVMLCLAHRDFTPWNTFVNEGRLFVFDWEFARPNWTPLTDAFHFILQKGILVDKAPPDVLWNRLMSGQSKEERFLRQCASLLNASEETILALLAFYLCDMMIMYQFHSGQEGMTSPDGERLLSARIGLLKIIGQRRGY